MSRAPVSTLVMFHDLLGFGSALSVAGGRFDSAMGDVAFQRILTLRATLEEHTNKFPTGTEFFHYNDAVVAILDASMNVDPNFHEAGSGRIGMGFPGQLQLLQFLGASATLHDSTRIAEATGKLGPGGRTFVVLGKRWNLPKSNNPNIQQVESLHANLAFAEAYAADTAGSKAGFSHPMHSSLYVNDHVASAIEMMTHMRKIAKSPQLSESDRFNYSILDLLWPELDELSGGSYGPFPENIFLKEHAAISVNIFHKTRNFRATTAHYARKLCDIDMVMGKLDKAQPIIDEHFAKHEVAPDSTYE